MRKIHPHVLDRTGQRYGKLVCLYIDRDIELPKSLHWVCKCDCGVIKSILASTLSTNKTQSCGCIRFEGYEEISKSYWSKLKRKASIRNINFNVEIKDAWELFLKQDKKCYLSNKILTFARDYDKYWLQNASLDRIDPNQDYNISNIQWCDKEINQIKNKYSNEEFIYWCHLLSGKKIPLNNTYIFPYEDNYKYKIGKYEIYNEISLKYWGTVKKGARDRKLNFDLSVEDVWNLFLKQKRKCALTKVGLKFVTDYAYNEKCQNVSLDRIDSAKGYTIDNVHWVHKVVNRLKGARELNYFLNICKTISNYQDKK